VSGNAPQDEQVGQNVDHIDRLDLAGDTDHQTCKEITVPKPKLASDLPRTPEEWMTMKAKATAERKAKRAAVNGATAMSARKKSHDKLEKAARKAARAQLQRRQRKARSLTHKVGYIGCSNSHDTVDGYHLSAGNKNYLWPSYDTEGGSIDKWTSPTSPYWSSYSTMVKRYGQPKYVWVQLCERADEGSFNTYDQVKMMIAILKRQSPNAMAIVSGINDYSPNPGLCDLMGTASATSPGNGVYDTKLWADQLVADKLVRIRGPYLGPLTAQLTLNDGCHPNRAGRLLLGNQLRKVIDVLR
jgi:hypothetical protein